MGLLETIFGVNKDGGSAGIGGLLGGIGALAGAWGQYQSDQKRNALLTDQFNYEKQKDALANTRFLNDRSMINDAFGITDPNIPKKKKTTDASATTPDYTLNAFMGA